jgi:predicted N-acyltransferase
LTRSMHCLRERRLDAAVAQFLRSEAREVEYVLEAMSAQMSPYKR